jgi:hypothetical protein
MRFASILTGIALVISAWNTAGLEIKLIDGTVITCQRATRVGGSISVGPGLDIWLDSKTRYGQPIWHISQESLRELAQQPELASTLAPYIGARFIPQPINRTVLAAAQDGFINLFITGDGKTELSLRVTRTGKANDVPLNLNIPHPLVVKSQAGGDSLMLLRPGNVAGTYTLPTNNPAQKVVRPTSLGGLQAVELGKSVIKTNTAFQIVEADAVIAYILSARSNLGSGSPSAVL